MASKKEPSVKRKMQLPGASSLALKGRQSVRATFKLTEGCIDAINIVATHLGIKQKSLFDHLIEDAAALKLIVQESRDQNPTARSVVTKTFVVSRNSMDVLNNMAEQFGVTRESLVELSVQRLLPIIAKEQVTHEERKKIIKQIDDHLKQGQKIHSRIKNRFGSDDIIYEKYDQIMANYQNCLDEIHKYIEKSRGIEKFEVDSF